MRFRKAQEPSSPTHWDVVHWLMKIDPPPPMGDDWMAGLADGVYLAQCYLRGRAQGQAINGDYAAAVETAKAAADLNRQRWSGGAA